MNTDSIEILLKGQAALDYMQLMYKPNADVQPKPKICLGTPLGKSPALERFQALADDIQFANETPLSEVVTPRFKVKESTSHSYPAGVTRASVAKPRWSVVEEGVISYRIDPLSTAAPSERKLTNVIAKLPERTEAAIRSKIIELGGCVTAGIIYKKA